MLISRITARLGCPDGRSGGLADLIDGKRLCFAEPDDEQSFRFESRRGMKQQVLAEIRLELAGCNDAGGSVCYGVGGREQDGQGLRVFSNGNVHSEDGKHGGLVTRRFSEDQFGIHAAIVTRN